MSLITRDLDGDELRVNSIRINEDGVRLSEPALSIDSIGRLSFNATTIDEERQRIMNNNGIVDNIEYDNIRVGRISTSHLRDDLYTTIPTNDWIDQGIFSNRRIYPFNNSSRPNDILQDLVFLDMKVENLGEQFKTTITYIDKKNYQEVKREYFGNVSFTQEFNISGNDKLNIEVEQYGEIKETRKDI